ncbi:polysaccharide deacetylase family protein [archaeon]|jgi:peptidoglycan-N-acetylglucosamine deacetylase|nr:polysaccharide deacetylase family protein [archaeon]MBT4351211.1 polysaccharide deacetylase family protein [archaeon]MBT4648191.1 polysaccharide deacetylase family protein [archaeon]MBT6821011.1 polysaccharide deacetylase family protein [archaeon]MBT7391642.1 polysaccharide deacetylase family protein [archaeon]
MIGESIIIIGLIIIFISILGYTLPFKTFFDLLYKNSIWHKHSKNIYLTFDDGPNKKITNFILNKLRKNNHKATFFIIPEFIKDREDSEIIKKIFQENHTIGLHTKSRWFCFKNPKKIRDYINSFEKQISLIIEINFKLKYFRPASGWRSQRLYNALKNSNLILVGWSPFCWPDRYTNDMLTKFKKCIKQGNIIVLHDGRAEKYRANRIKLKQVFPKLMKELKNRNIKSKSLDNN